MSELVNIRDNRTTIRWKLLTSVSVAALLVSACAADDAQAADDSDRPIVWIELGGQFEQPGKTEDVFAPPFVANLPSNFFSPLSVQKLLPYSFGGEASISFQPEESDWILSASLRFGRTNGGKHVHQQTPNARLPFNHIQIFGFGSKYRTGTKYPSSHVKFEDAKAQKSESHTVLDFQAGKDFGLGLFGKGGSSVFSAGVRFAQFRSRSNVTLRAVPDVHYPSGPITNKYELLAYASLVIPPFHDYAAMETSQRGFRGIGPSLSWNASAPFAGNPDSGEMTIDWGVNLAVLFGRQKVHGHHQTTVKTFHKAGFNSGIGCGAFNGNHFCTVSIAQHSNAAPFDRSRTVAVPNLGGFAGISYRFTNAKLSIGYRADYFFGAMDGGIDTRKSETLGFKGPFASISFGLGD